MLTFARILGLCAGLFCASLPGTVAAEEPGALVFYASDQSPAVNQELENLCSILSGLDWAAPTYMILPDRLSALLEQLGQMEKGKPVPIHERKTPAAELESWLVKQLLLRSNSKTRSASALRPCSITEAQRIQRVVALEQVPRDPKLLHYAVSEPHAERSGKAGSVEYDPVDPRKLLRALAQKIELGARLVVTHEAAGDLVLESATDASERHVPAEEAACRTSAEHASQEGKRVTYFCAVPPGAYELTAWLDGCGPITRRIAVTRDSLHIPLDCPTLPKPMAPESRTSNRTLPAVVPPAPTPPVQEEASNAENGPAPGPKDPTSGPPLVSAIALGVHAVALVGVIVTEVVSSDARDKFDAACPGRRNCEPSLKPMLDRANDYATANSIFWGAAAVSLAVALAWPEMEGIGRDDTGASTRLSGGCTARGCGVAARGHF